MEAVGLVDSQPNLRPADILTRAAIPNRTAALDVGVKWPEAAGAGDDCTQTMVEEKLAYYAAILPELERKGITYCPITFSSFGRRHETTSRIMQEAASRAARFRGQLNSKQMLRSWSATVTTELWRRVARMVKDCLPKVVGSEQLLQVDEG